MTEIVNRDCQHCRASFSPRANSAKYCGRACYLAAREAKGPELFWAKVDKGGANGCWLYMGFRKWDGYGWLARWRDGKPRSLTAHRYAWILTNGEPPKGMHIMHECDNPPCCNPDHLKLGTLKDNMADMARKGRARTRYMTKPLLHPGRVRPRRQS